jgi:hypothetical protein
MRPIALVLALMLLASPSRADPERRARRERTAGIILLATGAPIGLFGLGWFLASLPYGGVAETCAPGVDCSRLYDERFNRSFLYNPNTQLGFAGAVIGLSAVGVGGALIGLGMKERRRFLLAPAVAQNGSVGFSLMF